MVRLFFIFEESLLRETELRAATFWHRNFSLLTDRPEIDSVCFGPIECNTIRCRNAKI